LPFEWIQFLASPAALSSIAALIGTRSFDIGLAVVVAAPETSCAPAVAMPTAIVAAAPAILRMGFIVASVEIITFVSSLHPSGHRNPGS
jgi:hypothetical protein